MVQKQFFLLKGVGLATQDLMEEYNTIIETVENGREVTWADQSVKDNESCDKSSFMLSFQSTTTGKLRSKFLKSYNNRRLIMLLYVVYQRHGGPVVWALDCWSEGQWFEPGLCLCVVSLDKKLYSTLSLFTQVYNKQLANLWKNIIIYEKQPAYRGQNNILKNWRTFHCGGIISNTSADWTMQFIFDMLISPL